MATSIPLHPIAAQKLKQLKAQLQREEGRESSERTIANALVYGATVAQTKGMLNAFVRNRATHELATGRPDDGTDDDG